jgi:hypothetical protein
MILVAIMGIVFWIWNGLRKNRVDRQYLLVGLVFFGIQGILLLAFLCAVLLASPRDPPPR